jgi:hypothetical protein
MGIALRFVNQTPEKEQELKAFMGSAEPPAEKVEEKTAAEATPEQTGTPEEPLVATTGEDTAAEAALEPAEPPREPTEEKTEEAPPEEELTPEPGHD